ncbi:dienelactone hydrolase family protein [Sphingosinicella soli]|uniref:Carboxymethylenebutenolidase n=1 Tax=Sphingosinicella soli TaxID=333708 RepID=A0A7W7B5T8_9SPHN|nr:dienelactone hydrolase family protein [Sphingosinicella soli]MBB4633693.1 carboxymethylenebutenolidase [Sphingosinicella soli]
MTTDRLPEDRNWVATTGLSRRGVLVGGTFAAGFAAAVQPVAASTLKTDPKGLDERMVSISVQQGTMPAYRVKPAGSTRAPVILVVHEIFGVHEWIKDICRRFAQAGYYAIAPDLYARWGDATKEADIQKLIGNIVSKVPDAIVMDDLDRAAAFAAADGGDSSKLGITGFCWGGRITWLYAAYSPRVDAGVAWYGRLTGENKPPITTSQPVEVAARLKAPVLGLYGGKDKGIPVADVEAMQAALKTAKSPSKIILYPEADHGFLADYRPSYNEAAAKAAWGEAHGWFKANLK